MRNGPPEAVNTIFSTAPRLPSASDWKIALCSESTGNSVAPAARTARSITSPAHTRASLLARPTYPPRRIAARVGASPAAPVIAAMVQSACSAAAATTASAPAATLDPGASEGVTQRSIGRVVGDNGDLGTQRDRLFGQQNAFRPATRARTW